jgi:Transglycosylase SLT domain
MSFIYNLPQTIIRVFSYKVLGFVLFVLLIVQISSVSFVSKAFFEYNFGYINKIVNQNNVDQIRVYDKQNPNQELSLSQLSLQKIKQDQERYQKEFEDYNNQAIESKKTEELSKLDTNQQLVTSLKEVKNQFLKDKITKEEESKKKKAEELAKNIQAFTVPSGSKQDWMRAAGIPESDWTYVDFIVSKESTWNPSAINRSSGACGLAQALPCSKTGCVPYNDPVCSLKWQYGYVKARYKSYAGAYEFWSKNHWY